MKKTLIKSLALASLGAICLVGSAAANPINLNRPFSDFGTSGETTLDDVIADITSDTGPDAVTGQSNVGVWTESDGNAGAYLVSSNTGNLTSIFGIYSLSTGAEQDITFGSDLTDAMFEIFASGKLKIVDGNGTTYVEDFGNVFGFYLRAGEETFYTEDSRNAEGYGVDHNIMALSYQLSTGVSVNLTGLEEDNHVTAGNDDWLLAFEDWTAAAGGDGDFQDRLFFIEDIAAVPEPATMLLFGTGLAGLAGVSRRRKK